MSLGYPSGPFTWADIPKPFPAGDCCLTRAVVTTRVPMTSRRRWDCHLDRWPTRAPGERRRRPCEAVSLDRQSSGTRRLAGHHGIRRGTPGGQGPVAMGTVVSSVAVRMLIVDEGDIELANV
jgi:hypothetical protein